MLLCLLELFSGPWLWLRPLPLPSSPGVLDSAKHGDVHVPASTDQAPSSLGTHDLGDGAGWQE